MSRGQPLTTNPEPPLSPAPSSPLSTPPPLALNAAARALLLNLDALIAARVRREIALDEQLRSTQARADAEHLTAIADADATLDSALKRLDAAHRSRRAEAEARGKAEFDQARAEAQSQLRDFNAATDIIAAHAQKQLDEAVWLADTVVESGERKLGADHDLAIKTIESKRREVLAVAEAANGTLRRGGHPPLVTLDTPESPASAADRDNRNPQAIAESLAAAASASPAQWWFVIAVTLAVAGAGAGAAFFIKRTTPADLGLFIGAPAGVAVVVLLLVRALLRRRVPLLARKLAARLAAADVEFTTRRAAADADRAAGLERLKTQYTDEQARARREYNQTTARAQARRTVEGPSLEQALKNDLLRLRREHTDELARLDAELEAARSAAATAHNDAHARAADRRAGILADLERETAAERSDLQSTWKSGVAATVATAADLTSAASSFSPPWPSPAPASPNGSTPQPPTEPPPSIAFGSLAVDLATIQHGLSTDPALRLDTPTAFRLPAALDIADGGSLFVQHTPDSRAGALDFIRTVMLRLLASFPPGKVRFTIVDPVGLGQNFAGFMHLADHDPLLVSDRIWTEAKHIEQRLTDLTEHMENVIQKYLRNEYATIQQYNREAGEIAEPYRFLVIADFPANFTEAAARRLTSIVTAGARCGVFTLISSDFTHKVPTFAPVADVERSSQTLVWRDSRFVFKDENLGRRPLSLDPPPHDAVFNAVIQRTGALAKDGSRVQVPFTHIAPDDAGLFSLSAAEELRIPLGRSGARKLQYLSLGRGTRQHALIAGRTGSGKSTLLHVMISNLALWYSPDEVELYLIDFKKGVEFKAYAAAKLPHARVIAIESEREFGLSVLRRLDAELTRRGQLFRDAAVQDLPAYRAAAKRPLPRILLLVDEFQEFFTEDDKIAQESALLLDRLVRQGRAFGLHLVLGSQTLGGAFSIARSTMGQMAVRIALQSSEADSLLIMSDDNTAPRLLSRPGEAIYNDASGAVEGNSPFQVAWLPDDHRDRHLARVNDALRLRAPFPYPPPLIFEGNVPADPASNPNIARALGLGPAAASFTPTPDTLWLGDAISIKDPTSITFRPQSAANLLIINPNETAASTILRLALAPLAATSRLFILDPSDAASFNTVGPGATLQASLALALQAATSPPTHAARIANARDAAALLQELAAELKSREADASDPSTTHANRPAPIYFFINGLHRFRDLRRSEEFSYSSDPDEPAAPADLFAAIVRDGPPLGIHTIAWCDTVANLERSVSRQLLREFDYRVLCQMSASDSSHLIDSPAASNLGPNRALLYREDAASIEKFRPYAAP